MSIVSTGDSALVHSRSERFAVSSQLFLRGLGLVYLIAFASLYFQIEGLIGSQGISSAEEYLFYVKSQLGGVRPFAIPTIFWLGAGDFALRAACAIGVIAGAFVFIGLWQLISLLVAWVLYLSLLHVSQEFLSFQWDILLVEAGFIAIFLAPFSRTWSRPVEPSPWVWFLLRWLLFRLMFQSGLAKLFSGDPTWRNLTALQFHYETQPLPTPLAWYAHHLSGNFHALSVLVMFGIELGAPLLIFCGKRLRRTAFFLLLFLQLLIALTGNYAFFNFLTIIICFSLLDDEMLPEKWQGHSHARCPWPRGIVVPVTIILFIASCVPFSQAIRVPIQGPPLLISLVGKLSRFGLATRYGLFAVMTTTRPEILVEGSEDGVEWKEYEFRYKPGNLSMGPTFVAPYQPRLDWQLWFAALGDCSSTPWFRRFAQRLLEGSSPVLDLLKFNPFPNRPPKYIRSTVWDYRFTEVEKEDWWERAKLGPFCPVLSLQRQN